MTIIDRLRQYRRALSGLLSADADAADDGDGRRRGRDWEAAVPDTPGSYDPENLQNRADVLAELGLTPTEFVTRLLEAQGGQLKQQAFTDYTDWSEGTVSRVLQEAEAAGHVVRIRVGREKIVCLPHRVPESARPSTPGDQRGSA